jgi:prolyl-tRNA editing enzyme YbaK/EbsC (Cys-tRNA(Pro) deacylase)
MTDERASAFAARLAERGIHIEPVEMDDSTHTAAQAAAALGCRVEAIVKSLLFLAGDPEQAEREPVLVLASGPNRVDPQLIETLVGMPAEISDAKTVKKVSGSSIGGVPPLGHPIALRTVMDETLLDLPVVWAAAASAHSVFSMTPAELARLTNATVARVS